MSKIDLLKPNNQNLKTYLYSGSFLFFFAVPEKWVSYPKTSVPSWVNLFVAEKIPEHKIFEPENITLEQNGVFLTSQQFRFNYIFDDFPNDFMYNYNLEYIGSPLLEINVIKPDGTYLELISTTLPYAAELTSYEQRIFSTDSLLRKNITMQSDFYNFEINDMNTIELIFSNQKKQEIQT